MLRKEQQYERRKTIQWKDKGVLLTVILILCLTFSMGVLSVSKRKSADVTIFTRDDLDRIIKMQQMEDEAGSKAEIYAYKDEYGNLMIGWDYNDSKRR